MANLIIKPSAGGDLKLQDEGSTDAITISTTGNTTLAGTANNIGTVTAGTIGSAVVFNDAHKDIDVDADSWMRFVTVDAEAISNALVVWDGVGKMGSNITYDGTSDYIQVAKAGWYFISVHYGHKNKEDRNVELWVRQSQSTGATPSGDGVLPRVYGETMNDGIAYLGQSMSGFVYLEATDRVDVYGRYYTYGATTVHNAMTFFTGVRLGA